MNKTLILLNANFPYGKGETFLESEISYLSAKFKTVLILTVNNKHDITRQINNNVSLDKLNFKLTLWFKIRIILSAFISKNFFQEINFIQKDKEMTLSLFKIKVLLKSIINSEKIKEEIVSKVKKHNLKIEDCIFYSYWLDDTAIALATLSKKNKNIKAFSRTHRWDLYYEENPENYLPLRSYTLSYINCFSISAQGQHYLNKKVNIDTVKLSRLGTQKLALNPNKGLNEQKIIMSCSNLISVKRVSLIVESLSKIDNHDIKWIHFGDGPLFKSIKDLAIKNDLNFELKGNQTNKFILNFLQTEPIDLFINLSSSEGIPVSIMEAASCGIPTIATNVGGTSEIVDNENGILLNENPSAGEVSNKISDFFNSGPKIINAKRDSTLKNWEEKFNSEKNYTEFPNIISNL